MRDWLYLSGPAAELRGLGIHTVCMADVVRAVSDCSGVAPALILGPRRQPTVMLARHITMLTMREFCTWSSYPEIAAFIGGRDHSTIVQGCRTARERIESRPEYRQLYLAVRARLGVADEVREAA